MELTEGSNANHVTGLLADLTLSENMYTQPIGMTKQIVKVQLSLVWRPKALNVITNY